MNRRYATLVAALAAACIAGPALAEPKPFQDPLDVPAQMSPLAAKSLLQGVARAGDRLIAVGQRGRILVSSDNGATWKQSPVPVSSDLTAVHFVNDRKGWAVGHDGVVLATADGGDTWAVQLDGDRANERLVEHMQAAVADRPGTPEAKRLLDDAKRYKEQGADKPFLDVWFADESTGFVVGAYNLIFHTTDGGKNWRPWFDRTDNPKLFNLYAIRPAAGGLFIAGEGGLVLKLDPVAQRFRAVEVPYTGSFFGIAGGPDVVLVFGLRGNVFRSEDAGRTWSRADAGLPGSIVAGTRNAAGTIGLIDAGGRVAASDDGGRTFARIPMAATYPVNGVVEIGSHRYAIVGPRGVAVVEARRPAADVAKR
ncbi:MAG: YCF48-related protein [Burkholderiales bacterium]